MDIVGAGFACPIMQPNAHLQPQPGVHSQNKQWGHGWHVMQHGWHGQANPAPTAHMVNLNEFGKIVDEQWLWQQQPDSVGQKMFEWDLATNMSTFSKNHL